MVCRPQISRFLWHPSKTHVSTYMPLMHQTVCAAFFAYKQGRGFFLYYVIFPSNITAIHYGIDAFPLSSQVLSMVSLLFLMENRIFPMLLLLLWHVLLFLRCFP